MISKFIVFFLVLLGTTGCAMYPYVTPEVAVIHTPTLDVNSEEFTRLIQGFTVQLKHDEELNLEDSKVYFNESVHTISLEFITQRILDVCEARKLIVDVTEGLLERLNRNPFLKGEYAVYPFPVKNLEIYITCESFYSRYIDPYRIQWICLEDEEVIYYAWDLYDEYNDCWNSRHEPYKTAKEVAFAEREAEKQYERDHADDKSIFGDQRYFPSEP